MRRAERLAERVGYGFVQPSPAGYDNQIRRLQQTQIAIGQNTDPARCPELAVIHARHGELIPVLAHLRARQAKDFYRHAKLKGT